MTDDTPRMRLMRCRPDPSMHARCAWPGCVADASDRYPVELCQEHILYIWSLVDTDLRESAKTLDDLKREAEEEFLKSERVKEQMARGQRVRDRRRGYVYVLEVGGMIKIGFTANPLRRGAEYPPSSELLTIYPGTLADEKALHDRFGAYRVTGREWYMDVPEIRDYIAEVSGAPAKWERSMFRRPVRGEKPMKSATPRDVRIVG